MRGSTGGNQVGVYGTRLIPSDTTFPGARVFPISWIDSHDSLWLWGGSGQGTRNQIVIKLI